MRKRNLPENKSANQVKREKESIPWRYCLLTLFFGVLLVIGFFFAARQHFSAIDYGMKNGELKKRRTELEDENRRLTLAKEEELSISKLEKKAKEYGLVKLGTQATQIASEAKYSLENAKEKAVKTFLPRSQETKVEKQDSNEKKKDTEKSTDSDEKNDKKSESDKDKKSDKETVKSEAKIEKESKSNKNLSKTGN
jgi:hypothetical protein